MSLLRIGVQIELNDLFWVQVEQAVYHTADHLGNPIEFVPIEVSDLLTAHLLNEQGGLGEELLAHNLNALICKNILPLQLSPVLNDHLPVPIQFGEELVGFLTSIAAILHCICATKSSDCNPSPVNWGSS
jgi:hypothetical protein